VTVTGERRAAGLGWPDPEPRTRDRPMESGLGWPDSSRSDVVSESDDPEVSA
jgi:hypothetical protein